MVKSAAEGRIWSAPLFCLFGDPCHPPHVLKMERQEWGRDGWGETGMGYRVGMDDEGGKGEGQTAGVCKCGMGGECRREVQSMMDQCCFERKS
jgi:hypothetical protein